MPTLPDSQCASPFFFFLIRSCCDSPPRHLLCTLDLETSHILHTDILRTLHHLTTSPTLAIHDHATPQHLNSWTPHSLPARSRASPAGPPPGRWQLVYEGAVCNTQRHLRLTSGWRDFVRAHSIKVHDTGGMTLSGVHGQWRGQFACDIELKISGLQGASEIAGTPQPPTEHQWLSSPSTLASHFQLVVPLPVLPSAQSLHLPLFTQPLTHLTGRPHSAHPPPHPPCCPLTPPPPLPPSALRPSSSLPQSCLSGAARTAPRYTQPSSAVVAWMARGARRGLRARPAGVVLPGLRAWAPPQIAP